MTQLKVLAFYRHPSGATIRVFSDGTLDARGKDGRRKNTTATAEKLEKGHGQWEKAVDPLALSRFSDTVLKRAEKFVLDQDVAPDKTYPDLFWVASGENTYRVQVGRDGVTGEVLYVTCTCQHGQLQGGGEAICSHVAAATMVMLG